MTLVDEHYLPGLQLEPPSSANDADSPNTFTNIDGFGIGWYSETPSTHQVYSTPRQRVAHPDMLPAAYKCISPPLHDYNLQSLANAIESKVVFGHIRAATNGTVQLPNCHPFQWGRFLFQHNGCIGRFADIQLELMNLVGPRARSFVKGTTDTEWLAALFFHFLDPSDDATWLDEFSLDEQLDALTRTLATVINLVEKEKGGYVDTDTDELVGWFSANLAITDGDKLIALRFAYPCEHREAPSLYWSNTVGPTFDRKYQDHPDGGVDIGNRLGKTHQGHIVVASEPMTKDEMEWNLMPQQTVVVVDEGETKLFRVKSSCWQSPRGKYPVIKFSIRA
ncbi:class II glutamine amidotransferase [Sporobolomyces salmoneus]|uniref:class II glutamine amidotransferase n=1 Tax=Sporobolomyces salmoneus TaxID=183962 RepID=UPI003172A248